MSNFRQAPAASDEWIDVRKSQGFSNFHFVDQDFFSSSQLRRILSLVRKHDYQSMVVEEIQESDCSLLQEENQALATRCPDFQTSRVRRLLFLNGQKDSEPGKLLGYAIFREDYYRNQSVPLTHVYEAVVLPPRDSHSNNFLHSARDYSLSSSLGILQTSGVLYGKQNDRTYVCAQVALRTALSAILPDADISYARINELAGIDHAARKIGYGVGLAPEDMEAVIAGCGLTYSKIAHEPGSADHELEGEFQRELYGIIESGLPALLGFELQDQSRHIIPVFGHTFNDDTWVADSGRHYFGEGFGHFPSENWLSAYSVHDDNFGPYLCIPRHYISKDNFRLILGLKPTPTETEAPDIEDLGLIYARALAKPLLNNGTPWQRRFALFAEEALLVLRTILMKKEDYLSHLQEDASWKGRTIASEALTYFADHLPDYFWMVELSAPELFSATRHKFGELLLASDGAIPEPPDFSLFLAGRIPGLVIYKCEEDDPFGVLPSGIQSHVPLYQTNSLFQHEGPE